MRTFFIFFSIAILGIFFSYFIGAYNAYFYPMKYSKEIEFFSEKYDVGGAIIASVANVESNFDENAVSNKGAIGIMQLIPSTAEWIAGKIGKDYDEEKLKNAEYNLELGSFYLSYLINYFQDERVGICAYNAGQGNVSNWLKDEKYSKDGKTLYKIPFEETNNYLKKVLNNYNYYKNKYK